MITQEKIKEKEEPVALIEDGWAKFEKAVDLDQGIPEGFVEIGRGMIWKRTIRSKQHKCPKTMQKFLCKL